MGELHADRCNSTFRMRALFAGFALLCLFAEPGTGQPVQPTRLFTVDDLLSLAQIAPISVGWTTFSPIAISPDGLYIAIVVQRKRNPGDQYAWAGLASAERADVWLVSTKGGAATNITHGESDASGFWAPRWSPDGRRLAMLSTRGATAVRIFVWQAANSAITAVSQRGTDVGYSTILAPTGEFGSFVWRDPTTLIATTLPPGELGSALTRSIGIERFATKQWAAAHRGLQPTASIREAGIGADEPHSFDEIDEIDVVTSRAKMLGSVPYTGRRWVSIAPDWRHAAVLTQLAAEPMKAGQPPSSGYLTRLGVLSMDGRDILWSGVRNVSRIAGWSMDSTRFSILAPLLAGSDLTDARTWVVTAEDGSASPGVSVRNVSDAVWAPDGRMIIRGTPPDNIQDWFLAASSDRSVNLTKAFVRTPDKLLPDAQNKRLLTVADNSVWSIDPQRGTVTDLLPQAHQPGLSIPENSLAPGAVLTLTDASHSFYRLDLSQGVAKLHHIARPGVGAGFLAGDDASGILVFKQDEPDSTTVKICKMDTEACSTIHRINPQLQGIAAGQKRMVEYKSTDGASLNAIALLPPGYRPGQAYPTIVWVYGGAVYRTIDSAGRTLADNAWDNPQVLAAHGYVVLFPSMPMSPYGSGSDPLEEMARTVMPAVDQSIAAGITDGNRFGLIGHSYGGYTTLALLTGTQRFKAAVAMAGASDMLSFYGQFDPHDRYTDANTRLLGPGLLEVSQFRMAAPPWEVPDRYVRNSPLLLLDRIRTPLLMVAGDFDLAMGQAEEMYTGLYRLGRPVRFVRYFGEEHAIDSPANIRHLWGELFSWFDTYLRY